MKKDTLREINHAHFDPFVQTDIKQGTAFIWEKVQIKSDTIENIRKFITRRRGLLRPESLNWRITNQHHRVPLLLTKVQEGKSFPMKWINIKLAICFVESKIHLWIRPLVPHTYQSVNSKHISTSCLADKAAWHFHRSHPSAHTSHMAILCWRRCGLRINKCTPHHSPEWGVRSLDAAVTYTQLGVEAAAALSVCSVGQLW